MADKGFILCILFLLLFSTASFAQYEGEASPSVASTAEKGALFRFPKAPFSQPDRVFLNRSNWPGYLNYGKEAYERAVVSARSFELYDRLGYRLLRGYPLLTWYETYSDSLALRESRIFRSNQFWQWFDKFVILHDSYRGWNVGVMIGDNVRTTLTPLTLARARWDGVRIDGESKRYGFTLLSTRGQLRHYSSFQTMRDESPVIQYGGRWFAKLGGFLTAGLTFFNQYQVDMEAPKGSFIHGDLPYPMEAPSRIFVRVEDDSPLDGNPAGVYEIHLDIQVRETDGTWEALTFEPITVNGAGYSPMFRRVEGPGEAVDFEFQLPSGRAIRSARFHAKVAGDYRISVRQVHPYWNTEQFLGEEGTIGPRWEDRYWPSVPMPQAHNLEGRAQYPIDFKAIASKNPTYEIEFDAQDPPQYVIVPVTEHRPFYTVRRATGSPDLSHVRMVAFEYGIPVGQRLLGGDIEIVAEEFMLRGELVYNRQESKFPFANDSLGVRGKRFTLDALAGYVNVIRTFHFGKRLLVLGGEVFRLDPEYSGGYDSERGGVVLFTDRGKSYVGVKGREGRTKVEDRVYHGSTQEFALVSDNDDGDDWPDDWPGDEGKFQPRSPEVYSGAKGHSGVFPGLDEDGDGSPDTDRDRNGVPDWSQPFLLYESDAPDFVYGMDLNNNGVPDHRENDAEADYPYRRDMKGAHFFAKFSRPLPMVDLVSLGYYNLREEVGWGKAKGPYVRLEMSHRPTGWLEVKLKDDVKYVRDTIRDDVYIFEIGSDSTNIGSVLVSPPEDALPMKRSLANRAFLSFYLNPTSALNLRMDAMHFLNRQYETSVLGGERQPEDLFTEVAFVGRTDYSRRWEDFELWSGVKYVLKEGDRRSVSPRISSLRFYAPILRFGYHFTPDVVFQFGMSGFKGFPMRYKDRISPDRSYCQRNTIAMIRAHSEDYYGYNITINIGLQHQFMDFDEGGKERDYDTFGFFVDTFCGL